MVQLGEDFKRQKCAVGLLNQLQIVINVTKMVEKTYISPFILAFLQSSIVVINWKLHVDGLVDHLVVDGLVDLLVVDDCLALS